MSADMRRLPWASAVAQVCVVVHDLDATIRDYHEVAGIGPWAVWTPQLRETRVRGVDVAYSMKLALAWTNGFMWEVIQPLEGPSIYEEFLVGHGEGVHHVFIETADHEYDELLRDATMRGCPPLMEGTWGGARFAYLDTVGTLKTVLEVVRREPGYRRQRPDYWYPYPLGDVPQPSSGSDSLL